IIALLGFLFIPTKIKSQKEERLLANLEAAALSAIARAQGDASRFDFDSSLSILTKTQNELSTSELPADRVELIVGRVDAARQAIARAQGDHKQKLQAGYIVRSECARVAGAAGKRSSRPN